MRILIIDGPNINFLGMREKDIYPNMSYLAYQEALKEYAKEKNIELIFKQTNHEGEIIDLLQGAHFNMTLSGIILNAGGYTHTSIAIRDCISTIRHNVIEVHFSDISKREDFRKKSYLTDVCKKTFKGKGIDSYKEAIDYIIANKGFDK